jgi:hypothetical protein
MEIYLNAGNNRKKWYWFHFLIALYRIQLLNLFGELPCGTLKGNLNYDQK